MKRLHPWIKALLAIGFIALAANVIRQGELTDQPIEYKIYDGTRFTRVSETNYVSEDNPERVIIIDESHLQDTLVTNFNTLMVVRDWEAYEITYYVEGHTVTCDIRLESCEGGDPETLFTKNETSVLFEFFEDPAPPLGGLGMPLRLGILSLLYAALSVSVITLLHLKRPRNDPENKTHAGSSLSTYDRTYPVPVRKTYTTRYNIALLVAVTALLHIWFLFL